MTDLTHEIRCRRNSTWEIVRSDGALLASDLDFDLAVNIGQIMVLQGGAITNITFPTPPCIKCGERSLIPMPFDRYDRWQFGGQCVQNVFPDMSAELREVLVTGIHPGCWNEMFPEEEDDEEDEFGRKVDEAYEVVKDREMGL